MKRLFAIAALLVSSMANAADMPSPIVVRPRVLVTYQGSGWYYGLHTFAENQKIDANVTLGGAFAVGAAIGLTSGFMWGANGVTWQALEISTSYKNIAGGVPVVNTPDALKMNSRWSFTERFKFGGPINALLAMLPNLGTVFPTLPLLPAGGVGTTHPYLFGAAHQDDISESLGFPIGRAWRLKGGFGVGMMQQLGNAQNAPNSAPITMDVWAEYIPPSSAITFGIPANFIKTNLGRETRFGLAILY